jgi:hypothetical protein
MGIALASYVVMAGISYFNVDGVKAKEREAQWASLNLALTQGWLDTQRLQRRWPSSTAELLQQSKLYVGIPPGMNLAELGSGYIGWCFTGTAEKADVDALVSLATRFPGSYAIANDCGASNGIDAGWSPANTSTGTQALSLTYRLNTP